MGLTVRQTGTGIDDAMNEPNRPPVHSLWLLFSGVGKLIALQASTPAYRQYISAIARFHGYCAVAMTALCLMGVLIGKAPVGNAVGGTIFALAAVLLLRFAKAIRPTEISS